jgi:hypothetical protein
MLNRSNAVSWDIPVPQDYPCLNVARIIDVTLPSSHEASSKQQLSMA